jgi:NADH:ubiquinone oxidoreductase subunit 4 (subunit M)
MHNDIKEVGMVIEDVSRRSFWKKAAAAVGVVASAVYAKTMISRSYASAGDASAKYATDVALQEKVVKGNQLIVMTDDEKKQRLDELLISHYQEIA